MYHGISPCDVAVKHMHTHHPLTQINRIGFIHLAELIPLELCDGDI